MQKEGVNDIWFSDGIRRLRITCRVLEELFSYAERNDRLESGGIILGLVFENHDEVIQLVKPSKTDICSLFSFVRKMKPAQRRINKAWNKSGGHLIYLGEWHTHPRRDPAPSGQDRTMIRNALLSTEIEIDYLYLIIAGHNKSYWIGRQDNKDLRTLNSVCQ